MISHCAVALRAILAAAAMSTAAAAESETRSSFWTGVERIAVVCRSADDADHPNSSTVETCAEVSRQLGSGTRYPVSQVDRSQVDPFQDLLVEVQIESVSARAEPMVSLRVKRLGDRLASAAVASRVRAEPIMERGPASQLPAVVRRTLDRISAA
jgi:hypothetical protein